jgi:Fic-DOC domain mobile mystery protein B
MGRGMRYLRNIFGATPVCPDEIEGLIPIHITTQAELNEWEQSNIMDAQLWLHSNKLTTSKILEHGFIKKLHKKMFSKTWYWAGTFRKTDKNIGVEWRNISIMLKQLFDDVDFQLRAKSYLVDEIAARFHHRLVFIHPFVNGNGRLSRLITDQFLISQKEKPFSWGMLNFKDVDDIRKRYVLALRAADKYDYSLLLDFVRS